MMLLSAAGFVLLAAVLSYPVSTYTEIPPADLLFLFIHGLQYIPCYIYIDLYNLVSVSMDKKFTALLFME